MSKINPYIIIDFETGGLDCTKCAVTEVGMICVDGETFKEIGRYESYISPYIAEYNQQALDFTGITMDLLNQKGKSLKEVVTEMATFFKEMKELTSNSHTKKPILVGHNIGFDLGFLQSIFKEAKMDMSTLLDGTKDYYNNYRPLFIDTIVMSKLAWGNDEMMSNYKLGTCVEKSGGSLNDGHKAINDVIATKELLITFVNKLRSQSSGGGVFNLNTPNMKDLVRVRNDFKFEY